MKGNIFSVGSGSPYAYGVLDKGDFDLTEKLDYSSAVALLGYSFILALLRTFNVKDEASRVMFAAPILAFVFTSTYFNFDGDIVLQILKGSPRLVVAIFAISLVCFVNPALGLIVLLTSHAFHTQTALCRHIR